MDDAEIPLTCWCGNRQLVPFGPMYSECKNCGTLVSEQQHAARVGRVSDDATDFYGREYWLSHVSADLNQANIIERARADLPERCLYWLRTMLHYLLPPARVLELGSGPGTFVALLRWAGFDATGLELSPWVVDYSQHVFGIPVLSGPVEDQDIEPQSLDAVVLMDVLEHLPDPVGTLRRCVELLKPSGMFIIQTPRFPHGKNYEQMVGEADRFLEQLKPIEHLYLFSDRSIRRFFGDLGLADVTSEPAIFAHYDMFIMASRQPAARQDETSIAQSLAATPGGRLIQALLDMDDNLRQAAHNLDERERDRAARLEVIHAQGDELGRLGAERNILAAQLEEMRVQFESAEADRAARLEVIHAQGDELGRVQAERNILAAQLEEIRTQLKNSGTELEAPRVMRDAIGQLHQQDAFDAAFDRIREPKAVGMVTYTSGAEDRIVARFMELGIPVIDFRIDVPAFRRYFADAGYPEDYYPSNIWEKSLEHFIAATLLDLRPSDTYIDIASEHSPVPDIYRQLFGVTPYRQDLAYEPGLDGDRIGGDAANMPIPAGFANKMALHCSFEHFENDSDSRFIREIGRVLQPGGAVCFVPFYVAEEYAILTDPEVADSDVHFEEGVTVRAVRGWNNRFGRFYDPAHVYSRLWPQLGDLSAEVLRIRGANDVDPSCYARFALKIKRPMHA